VALESALSHGTTEVVLPGFPFWEVSRMDHGNSAVWLQGIFPCFLL